MRRNAHPHRASVRLALAVLAIAALTACEKGKPRHPPPDPMAAGPPPVEETPPIAGLSKGLVRRPEPAGVFLDHAGAAADPANHQPAVTPRDRPAVFDGFGFDPVAKLPAKGVDVVIDDRVYGTTYGAPRQDVAHYFKTPALVDVGFRMVLPTGSLSTGVHSVMVRVVAADGKGYFESPPIAFSVN